MHAMRDTKGRGWSIYCTAHIYNRKESHQRGLPPPEGHYAPPKWFTLRCHNASIKLGGTRLRSPFITSKPKRALSGSLMRAGGSATFAERLHTFMHVCINPILCDHTLRGQREKRS